jgi:zinc transport system permease protein
MLALEGLWQRLVDTPLYHQAFAGSVAIALLCGVLSVFVVLKRMSFIGQGISHAAFGGVGVAVLVELLLVMRWPQLASGMDSSGAMSLLRDAIIAVFCVATAIGIGVISRRGKLAQDTAIGISLVAAMAVGVILVDIRSRYRATASFESILFGSIFFIARMDVWTAWILAIVVVALVLLLFKEMVFFAFDEETAAVFGVPTTMLYYGLLTCLGLAIVVAMKSLGVILASALLILPGASARFWSRRIGVVTFLSALISVGGLAGGLLLSIALRNVPPGAVIVLTLTGIFVLSYAVQAVRRAMARRQTK